MLNEIRRILNNMDQNDVNVMAIKALLDSYQNDIKVYMLYYKGKPLHCEIHSTGDADFCNDTRVNLTDDDYYPVWTTTDIRTAAYVKYVSTEWYNSDVDCPEHKYKPEELEIRDCYGNVYNRKPITIKTKAILYKHIYKDNYLMDLIESGQVDPNHPCAYGEQMYLLEEVKEKLKRIQGKVSISKMSIDGLYKYRKELVKAKGELLKSDKSTDKIQKKLDSVNKKIVKLGGR